MTILPKLNALAWDDEVGEGSWMKGLQESLKKNHIHLMIVTDSDEFMSIFPTRSWDFIVLDLLEDNKPTTGDSKLTGLQLAHHLRGTPFGKITPIFFVTNEWDIASEDLVQLSVHSPNTFLRPKRAGYSWAAKDIVAHFSKPGGYKNRKEIFLIHGHGDEVRIVSDSLRKLGMEPVILQYKASGGLTIIEKIEKHANVGFAVAILTPDDIGALASDSDANKTRARQNVIFEIGYFAGKMGRENIALLNKGTEELPSDLSGMVYIPYDDQGAWEIKLAKELHDAGMHINLNRILQ